MALAELNRTIQYAYIRCLSVSEIVDRISELIEETDENVYIQRLAEIDLTESDFHSLIDAMNRLAMRSENSPSRLKGKIDHALLRLVRLLPSDIANDFAEPYVNHPRKARRKWAYSALRGKQISQTIAAKLVKVFHETADQEVLLLIARNPERVPEVGAEFLLKNIEEEYWRARVVEAMLIHDRSAGLSLSDHYPFEFAHSVGRVGDKSLIGPLCDLFEANSDNLEFLSIYAYALGKLGAKAELKALEQFIESTYKTASSP